MKCPNCGYSKKLFILKHPYLTIGVIIGAMIAIIKHLLM